MTAPRSAFQCATIVWAFGLCLAESAAQEQPALNPISAIAKASLTSFAERPLFDPTRRPPPKAPAAVEPSPAVTSVEPPPSLRLFGVIHGRHDMAVIQRDSGGKTVILRSGDQVGAWTLTVRPPVGISLTRGDRVVNYALFDGPGR